MKEGKEEEERKTATSKELHQKQQRRKTLWPLHPLN
jgi:hypothetical protein